MNTRGNMPVGDGGAGGIMGQSFKRWQMEQVDINEARQQAERGRVKREALDQLKRAVREAVATYDQSGDHIPNHMGDDCVRCQLLVAIGEARG